ncbi:sodium-dependent transporter [Streptomyces sp. NPDC008079]|uniref:sodium-dependent transporter n=1 Tax=Streptomyces sp. NPDC008079 TaxID=3364806 RepID=UPI0036E95D82
MRAPFVPRALARVQRSLTWLMALAYAVATVAPAAGLWLRHLRWSVPRGVGVPAAALSPPSALLAFVLFTAALQVPVRRLPALARRPGALMTGTAVNAAVPLLVLPLLAGLLRFSPDTDGGSGLLTGIALVGAMPVAGGATVWGGRAGGNHALVVGIVLASTLLSPLTTPLTLSMAAVFAHGHYAHDLGRMAGASSGAFALAGVVTPCLAGLLAQRMTSRERRDRALPGLKLAALLASLLLTYANACGALGGQLRHPQVAFIAASVGVAALACLAALAVGWGLARGLRSDRADTVAITLASGMNNSSASAVLAATHLPAHPQVLMPVLAYSIVQKFGAGAVDSFLGPRAAAGSRRRRARPRATSGATRPRSRAGRGD